MTTALVLGGGAPNLTLMAGALLAMDEAGVCFDVVSTTGAGMLVGLLYAAPKNGDRQAALAATPNMGVSDSIYKHFPVNYKVFHKPGTLAEAYTRTMQKYLFQFPQDTPMQRLTRDIAEFWSAAFCPTDLSTKSLGLCQAPPWIEEVVDFDAIPDFPGDFYLSAYSVDRHKFVSFRHDELNADHFKAALAFPFIYSPFEVDGETFIEGSALETLNYEVLCEERDLEIHCAVAFDILGQDKLIRKPRNLYDAWVLSIILPLTKLAQQGTELFSQCHHKERHKHTTPLLLPWAHHMRDQDWETIFDWSYSNLSRLFDVGYKAGHEFCDQHGEFICGHTVKHHAAAAPMTRRTAGARKT